MEARHGDTPPRPNRKEPDMPGYEYGATHTAAAPTRVPYGEATPRTPPRRPISDPEAGMLALFCTKCEAAPGMWCTTPKGARTTMHLSRAMAWRTGDVPADTAEVRALQDVEGGLLADLTAASSRLRRAIAAHDETTKELANAQYLYDETHHAYTRARDRRVAAEEPEQATA